MLAYQELLFTRGWQTGRSVCNVSEQQVHLLAILWTGVVMDVSNPDNQDGSSGNQSGNLNGQDLNKDPKKNSSVDGDDGMISPEFEPILSPGGSEILRHELDMSRADDAPEYLSEADMDLVSNHIKKMFGESEMVLHEIATGFVHIDLIPIKAAGEERPFVTVCTMGMSAAAMTIPEDFEGPQYAELLMTLPAGWPMPPENPEDMSEDHWWPYRWLKQIAQVPSMFDTFVATGHTIPNGDPPEAITENVPFVGVVVVPQVANMEEESATTLDTGDREIAFYQLIPLLADEMDYKLEHGFEALIDLLEASEMYPWEMADPARVSLIPKE